MIADSLGCFYHFRDQLPHRIMQQVQQIYEELDLAPHVPIVYPALRELLQDERNTISVNQYRLAQPIPVFSVDQEAICG